MNLEQLAIDSDVEQNEDFLPGGDFTLETGLYPMTVDMAYLGESTKGAVSVTVHLKEAGGKRTHRETFYVTSGKEKGRKNTYIDKRSGKKRLLPGMETVNQLALITAEKNLQQLSAEVKLIKLWNFEARKELPTEVNVLTEILGTPVLAAITKNRENKRQKVGDKYIDTAAERVFNEVGKFLHPNGRSVAEEKAGVEDTPYRDGWAKKFGPEYVNDKYVQIVDSAGVTEASSAAATASAQETEDLFSDPA